MGAEGFGTQITPDGAGWRRRWRRALARRRQPRPGASWTRTGAFLSLVLLWTAGLQVAIIAVGLALPLLAVVPLDLQERLIDSAIPSGQLQQILRISAAYAGVVVLSNTLKFMVTYMRGWIQEIVIRILRIAVVQAQRRRNRPDAVRKLGAVTSVVTAEVDDLGAFAAEVINTPLIEGGTLVSLFSFALLAEPRLAAAGIVALLAQGILTPVLQNRINRLTRKRITVLRGTGLSLIDAAETEAHREYVAVARDIRHVYRLRLRMNMLRALVKFLNNIIMHAARIVIFAYGGWLVMQGEIGIGLIVAFLSGLGQIDDHWSELLDYYRRLTDARVKFRLVATALGTGPDDVTLGRPGASA